MKNKIKRMKDKIKNSIIKNKYFHLKIKIKLKKGLKDC